MANYKQQATEQYDSSYNQKVNSLKNQLAQNQQALEQQKGGINANFDTQVANQNLSNRKGKNNLSNGMLGRGLSNSSIAVSGLAEADQINNRQVGQINTARTGALNDIDAQKSLLEQNLNGTLANMSADREDAINALARQLEDRDWDKGFKNNQLAMEREKMLAQQQYQNMSLAQQKELAMLEQQYKNASLAQQRELANQQLSWQREQALAQQQNKPSKEDELYNNLLVSYHDTMNNPNMSDEQKYNMSKSLYSMADSYQGRYGFNMDDFKNMIYKSGNRYDSLNKKYK